MSHSALRRATLFVAGALAALAILAPSAFANPTVTVEPPSGAAISLTTAVPSLTINPNGSPTYYWIEYGKTKLYGNSTPHFYVGSGESPVKLYPEIVGLEGMTTYHFRVQYTPGEITTPDMTFENLNDWKVGSTRVSKPFTPLVGFEDTSTNGYFELQGAVGVYQTRIRCNQWSEVSGVLGVSITSPEFGSCFVQLNGASSSCSVTPFTLQLNGQLAQTNTLKLELNEGCPIGKSLSLSRGGFRVPQSPQATEFKSELWGVTYSNSRDRWDAVISLDKPGLAGSWKLTGAEAGKAFGVGE